MTWGLDPFGKSSIYICGRVYFQMNYRSITGEEPPTVPFTSKEYTRAGLPCFEFYNENAVPVAGADNLNGLKSVTQIGKQKGDVGPGE
jgi:hypothetical protein